MKASELIEKVQEMVEEHGDIVVKEGQIEDPSWVVDIEKIEIGIDKDKLNIIKLLPY